MALGFLSLDYDSVVLPYDDEQTPIKLTGKKMLPILEFADGSAMNESLDIIEKIDEENELKISELKSTDLILQMNNMLDDMGKQIHNLAMPYFIYTKEFNESSRSYFLNKKEAKRGPFKNLFLNQKQFLQDLKPFINQIEKSLDPFYHSNEFTIKDILVASHLWALYIVPEFQFNQDVHLYLQEVKRITRFNYHQDLWK